jgi:PAS domain S-box-containing protein
VSETAGGEPARSESAARLTTQAVIRDPRRLRILHGLDLLDSAAEEAFDRFTRLASRMLGAPAALISLIDADRQFLKSAVGLPEPWASARETPLSHSFCQYAVGLGEPLIVTDARLHPLLRQAQDTTDLGMIAYAGFPLMVDGEAVGALCAIDEQPRSWTDDEVAMLRDLAASVSAELALRHTTNALAGARDEVEILMRATSDVASVHDLNTALGASLRNMAELGRWDYGEAWLPDERAGVLTRAAVWARTPGAYAALDHASARLSFARGEGLAGSAWQRAEPVWLPDLALGGLAQQRAPLATGAGFTAAAAVPVLEGDSALGVFTFFAHAAGTREEHRFEMLLAIAGQIAPVLRRLTAEAALRSVQNRFGAVLAAATENSIIGIDVAGTITTFNPGAERMLGYRAADVIGQATPMIIHDAAEVAARAAELGIKPGINVFVEPTRDGSADTREWTYIRRDGSRLPVSLTVTSMRDADGVITGYIGIATDITERRRAEAAMRGARDAAEAATRARTDFLANMSHEIRTPMNAVIGLSELLLDTPLDEQQAEYADLIRTSAESLLRIINDILDFSRIDAGRLEIEHQPFNLRELFNHTLKSLRVRARQKGISLCHRIDTGLPDAAVGDAGRMRQVLVNLVSNAIKFTDAGAVTVTASADADPDGLLLHVEVRDTGIGIPADRLDRIFAAFTQADSSVTRRFGGTGLGLTISAQLVGLMGGRIWVESEPGAGSAFHFTARLGHASEAGIPRSAQPASQPALPPRPPLHLLVAEDNAVNQKLAADVLQRHGHTCAIAKNGQEAVDMLAREAFDAVLMDVQMPVLDGLEATRIIRQREQGTGRRIPIVALTAHVMAGDRETCIGAGMDDYLPKPLRANEVLAALAALLSADAPAAAASPAAMAHTGSTPEHARMLEAVGGDAALLRELAALYLRETPGLLKELREAVARGDAAAAGALAHRLRGSAAVFRYDALCECTDAMQVAARERGPALHGLLDDVVRHAASLEELLRLTQ